MRFLDALEKLKCQTRTQVKFWYSVLYLWLLLQIIAFVSFWCNVCNVSQAYGQKLVENKFPWTTVLGNERVSSLSWAISSGRLGDNSLLRLAALPSGCDYPTMPAAWLAVLFWDNSEGRFRSRGVWGDAATTLPKGVPDKELSYSTPSR